MDRVPAPQSRSAADASRPGSDFLQDLNRDAATLGRIEFTTIWTPFDLMIVPAGSSRLGVGRSIRVNVAAHPLMVRDSRALELVHRILNEDGHIK